MFHYGHIFKSLSVKVLKILRKIKSYNINVKMMNSGEYDYISTLNFITIKYYSEFYYY